MLLGCEARTVLLSFQYSTIQSYPENLEERQRLDCQIEIGAPGSCCRSYWVSQACDRPLTAKPRILEFPEVTFQIEV
jgi:hypothetical protein